MSYALAGENNPEGEALPSVSSRRFRTATLPKERAEAVLNDVRRLAALYPQVVLAGGWATVIHAPSYGGPAKPDVELLIGFMELAGLRGKLRLSEPAPDDPESRWSTTLLNVGAPLHVRLPYQASFGRVLGVPVQNLIPHSEVIAGVRLLRKEALLVCHVAALVDANSDLDVESQKAAALALLALPGGCDWQLIRHILSPADLPKETRLQQAGAALSSLAEEARRAKSRGVILGQEPASGRARPAQAPGNPKLGGPPTYSRVASPDAFAPRVLDGKPARRRGTNGVILPLPVGPRVTAS